MNIDMLKDYIEKTKFSQSKIATMLGVSPAVVSQYLKGEYKGDVEAVNKKVAQMLERQAEKAKDVKTDFVMTKTANRILEICGLAHAMSDIYLVIGEAGLGKTMALKQYVSQNSNVIMLEIDPTFSVKVLLNELCNKLGIVVSGSKSNHHMMDLIVEKLKGSERLLIIDEAELLAYKPLEILRRIHDKAGMGMVLAGMPHLRANLRGGKGEYKQLYSRVGLALDIKKRLPSEDIALLCQNALGTDEFNEKLDKVSYGNARRLSKLLRGVNRLAVVNKKSVDLAMIERFAEMLID